MVATTLNSSIASVLASRASTPSKIELHRISPASTAPRRVTKVHLAYRITGSAVEREHAMRAIELAVTKYCSVRDSLDPEMPVTWSLELLPG